MKKLSAIFVLFFTGFFLFATERLLVNNIEINDFKNPTDILGDGTAVFDPASATLTLNKASLTKGASGKGLEYAEFPAILFEGNLTIVLKGKNSITVGSDSVVMGEKLHNNAIIGSGSLSICVSGKNPGGALMMDKNGVLTFAQGAALYEGNSEPGALVKALTWSSGLSKETKRFVKIVVN